MVRTDTYLAALDIGTTTIRCIIINSKTEIVGSANSTVQLIYPKPGYVEINPDQLWDDIIHIIKSAVSSAHLEISDIKSLGISTQRATFITWSKSSGKPFHNFITWKDIRAKELCKKINSSLFFKTIRWGAYSLYLVTRSSRFLTGSRLNIASNHVTGRLLWTLQHIPALNYSAKHNDVMFGTLDTWLLYKLTKGQLHVTDISNASATGFFDPFVCEWGSWAKSVLGIPETILPKVVPNDFDFGNTAKDIFGFSIPINSVMADQSASMFASCCFKTDDLKITLGTGAFLDVNTSPNIHTSVTGIYPLISWKIKNEITYMGEVACNDCGSLIQWLLNIGLIRNPSDLDQMVNNVKDSDGVYFIPAFSGFGPPINDERSGSGFLGVKATTNPNHLVRAVLEGIVFRIVLAFQTLKTERRRYYEKVVIDGGVSKNEFICQRLSDLTELLVEKSVFGEMSALGVGFLAGLSKGIWKSQDELKQFRQIEKTYKPNKDPKYREKCLNDFIKWKAAIGRFAKWYDDE